MSHLLFKGVVFLLKLRVLVSHTNALLYSSQLPTFANQVIYGKNVSFRLCGKLQKMGNEGRRFPHGEPCNEVKMAP